MSKCGNQQGKTCTLHGEDVTVGIRASKVEGSIRSDNQVIFSWLFKHNLRCVLTVQLAREKHFGPLTMLDLACL